MYGRGLKYRYTQVVNWRTRGVRCRINKEGYRPWIIVPGLGMCEHAVYLDRSTWAKIDGRIQAF